MIYLELENKIIGSLLNNYSFAIDLKVSEQHFRDKNNKTIIAYFLNNKGKIVTMESGQAETELILNYGISSSILSDLSTRAMDIKNKSQFDIIQNEMLEEFKTAYMKSHVLERLNKLDNEEIDLEEFKSSIRGLCDEIDINEKDDILLDTEESSIEISELLDGDNEEVLPTKFGYLNEHLGGGFYKDQMTVVAARPSIGKTAMAIQLFLDLTKEHKGIFFSVESSRQTIYRRIMSNLSNIPLQKIREKKLNDEEIAKYTQCIGLYNARKAFITDFKSKKTKKITPKTIENICSYARKVKYKYGLDFIVIDHLLEVKKKDKCKDKREQIDLILEALRDLLQELNISVILLAQIGREAERRDRPTLADLKESGGIEEKADNVLILHRETRESEDMELYIAKARDGKTNTKPINLCYKLATQYIYQY